MHSETTILPDFAKVRNASNSNDKSLTTMKHGQTDERRRQQASRERTNRKNQIIKAYISPA